MSYAVDFVAGGEISKQGNLQVVRDLAALNNAIKLWFGSLRGERLYRPNKGGIILPYLLKPMSDDTANDISKAVREGLRNDFEPSITVKKCEVVPVYENNWYEILVVGFCPELNSDVYYNDTINSLRI